MDGISKYRNPHTEAVVEAIIADDEFKRGWIKRAWALALALYSPPQGRLSGPNGS